MFSTSEMFAPAVSDEFRVERSPVSRRSASATATGRWTDPDALDGLLRSVVTSVDPSAAFTSLAAACVPAFADECSVSIVDEANAAFRAAYPPAAASPAGRPSIEKCAVARVEGKASGGEPAYWATVSFGWYPTATGTTTDGDDANLVIARLLTERVADQVARERLEAAFHREAARVTNLEAALASNREIGQAMGIVMASHKVTTEQAFDLLRVASQNSNRKLRDVAGDVIQTGVLESPSRSTPER